MKERVFEYKNLLKDKQFLESVALAVVLFVVSMVINYYSGTYATESASNPVTDVILSNTRVYDLDGLFVYGSLAFFFFTVFVCLNKPRSIPFVLKSVAIFYAIRGVFVSLTHIGPFPSQLIINSNIINKITFGGDLFFSGHTGLPFLLALIFWRNKLLRNIFLCFSLGFAVVVLLAHMHYTIDVLSAFFITYTIYHISEFLFRKDKKRWDSS